MCDPVTATVAMTGLKVAGTISSHQAAKKAAKAQNQYNDEVYAQQESYRREVIGYQQDQAMEDLKYATKVLDYSQEEWNRQADFLQQARAATDKNVSSEGFGILLRMVEETISSTLTGQQVKAQGQATRAGYAAKDRSVEGNTIAAVLGDVTRQEGEALAVQDMNRSATMRQLVAEGVQAKASQDQQLANIQLQTYSPQNTIRMPSPIAPVQQAAKVNGPSTMSLITNVASDLSGGVSSYAKNSGTTVNDTVSGATTWMRGKLSL